jgi:hypothetical protein
MRLPEGKHRLGGLGVRHIQDGWQGGRGYFATERTGRVKYHR